MKKNLCCFGEECLPKTPQNILNHIETVSDITFIELYDFCRKASFWWLSYPRLRFVSVFPSMKPKEYKLWQEACQDIERRKIIEDSCLFARCDHCAKLMVEVYESPELYNKLEQCVCKECRSTFRILF